MTYTISNNPATATALLLLEDVGKHLTPAKLNLLILLSPNQGFVKPIK